MTNYVKSTDFNAKDALSTGNPLKVIKGSELDDEFDAIATASATKADLASPEFTGTPKSDTLDELTPAAGVTIDSVLLKDGGITASGDIVVSAETNKDIEITSTHEVLAGPVVRFRKANGGATPTIITNNRTIGSVEFHGYDGASYIEGAAIFAAISGTPGTNDMPTELRIQTTADGASSPTTRITVRPDGYVDFSTGIITATSTPSSASDTGIAGQVTWDSDYIYVCTATNTWKRVAIATW